MSQSFILLGIEWNETDEIASAFRAGVSLELMHTAKVASGGGVTQSGIRQVLSYTQFQLKIKEM